MKYFIKSLLNFSSTINPYVGKVLGKPSNYRCRIVVGHIDLITRANVFSTEPGKARGHLSQ